MQRKPILYVELAARWYVFAMLTIYGLGKLGGGQFYRKGHLPTALAQKTLEEISSFELAWTFMGHSSAYVAFVGVSQLLGAGLLLWNRTKLFGVAILVPILLNIIVFDIVFGVPMGALASACLYFGLLLVILYANHDKLLAVIQLLRYHLPTSQLTWPERLQLVGIVAAILLAIRIVEQYVITHIG